MGLLHISWLGSPLHITLTWSMITFSFPLLNSFIFIFCSSVSSAPVVTYGPKATPSSTTKDTENPAT